MTLLLAVLLTQTPPTVTLADLEKGCARGDAEACVDYGFNLETTDPEKAVAVYRTACTKGTLAACSNLALMLRDARGAPKNFDEAARVAKKACDGGNVPGCLHLALVKDAANDFAGATAAYEHACKLKVQSACTNLAVNLLKGAGIKRDEKRGVTLLEQSCGDSVKKGAPFPSLRSCMLLGQLYEQGGVVTANRDAAKRLYTLACYGGLEEGCSRLGKGPRPADDGHGH